MSVYTIPMSNQTVAADATLVIVHADSTVAAPGSVLKILRVSVSQNETETGQQLGVILGQKVTAFGTYTATTPVPHVLGGPASAITGATTGAESTCGTDASAEGAGAVTALMDEGFDNRNGFLWVPTEKEQITVMPDIAFIVKMRGTPATLTGWNAYVTFEEQN